MSHGLSILDSRAVNDALEDHLERHLAGVLRQRDAGHCMRVADLDPDLALGLAARLRATCPDATVVVLTDDPASMDPAHVTATKLVELRNPRPDGSLRPPLLVFVPNSVRTSAEDSFGVATFEAVPVAGAYGAIRNHALESLPPELQRAVRVVASVCDPTTWPWADDRAWVRYLLTVHQNGPNPEVAGASLYELALIPDRELYTAPGSPDSRVRHNLETVRALTYDDGPDRTRVLALPITDAPFKASLAAHLTQLGLDDPARWTRQIVADRSLWPYTFDKWPFEESTRPTDKVRVEVSALDLPVLEEGNAEGRETLTGQQVLTVGKGGLTKFALSFLVDPSPTRVQGLSHFRATVHAQDGTPVGLSRRKKAWTTNRSETRLTFNRLNKVEWDEGWYFIRVLAFTEDDEPIPLVDADGRPVQWGGAFQTEGGKRPNDSDLFYVLQGEEADVEPPQRSVPRRLSYAHALIELQTAAVTAGRSPSDVELRSVTWSERTGGGTATAELRFGRDGAVSVPVVGLFRSLQRQAVGNSDLPASWHVQIRDGVAETPTLAPLRVPTGGEGWQRLVETRHEFLRALGDDSVVEVTPLGSLRSLALDYTRAYQHAVDAAIRDATTPQGQRQLAALLRLDTTEVTVTERRGVHRSALLVGPTHPLRAAWLVTWAALADAWVQQATDGPDEHVALVRSGLLHRLSASGHPLSIPTTDGSLYIAAQDLHPFWSLYAPHDETDPRGLAGAVARAVGLSGTEASGGIDGAFLASRVRHYLRQRPYVRTLIVNAFNPGRATALADALVELQRDSAYGDLHYDVRLFGPDPTAPAFGDAFDALVDADGRTTSQAADAFSSYGGDHRAPKLAVARVATDSFHGDPDPYQANLSFLFDAFPPAPVQAEPAPHTEAAPVHGLVASTRTQFVDTGHKVAWTRIAEAGRPTPVPDADGLAEALTDCARTVSRACATLAVDPGGHVPDDPRPALVLDLSSSDRLLIRRVHDVSDWVVTLDRTLGVEFFDHGGLQERPDFLIDHAPASDAAGGRHVVVTARSNSEVLSVISDALDDRDLPSGGYASKAVFNALRALSPQLTLKLVANPTQRAEALGLALAKLFLDRKGATAEQIAVPLDAHTDLYDEVGQAAQALGEAASLRRTDLALFDLRPAERLITCNLVEVKAYAHIGDLGAYAALRSSVADQLRESEQALQLHFDPTRVDPDRPDRALKAHDLRALLRYYLDRAARFGVLTPTAARESGALLAALEDGYRLAFSRSAILFDLGTPGFDDAMHENGVDYFRIGRDLAQGLLQYATDLTAGTLTEDSLAETSLPDLPTAAFLAPQRAPNESDAPNSNETGAADGETTGQVADGGVAYDTTSDVSPPSEGQGSPSLQAGAPPSPPQGLVEPNESNPDPSPEDTEVSNSSQADTLSSADDQPEPLAANTEGEPPAYDVMLGVQRNAEQYGILGETSGRTVALDLNHTHTISLFGVQGGGKSYTLGSIIEMAARPIPKINHLPRPLAVVLFHYSATQDYKPEFTSMVKANTDPREVKTLRERYGANPAALPDVHLLVPPGKVDERREEYPDLPVHPLQFSASELQASHWSFLMGIAGNSSAYVKQLKLLMRDLRDDMTLPRLRQAVEDSALPDGLKQLARLRLAFAEPFISEGEGVRDLVRPGRLLIVDLRDEYIEQDEALGLFSVLLQLASDADAADAEPFNKLVVFDEAHKYTKNTELVEGLVGTVREMRHKGTSVLIASQDPPSIPTPLIELSSQMVLHKFNSPAWLKHVQKANAALGHLTPEMMTALGPGEAYVWSSKASDKYVTHHAVKVACRPRATHHGGSTRTAVE